MMAFLHYLIESDIVSLRMLTLLHVSSLTFGDSYYGVDVAIRCALVFFPVAVSKIMPIINSLGKETVYSAYRL